MSKESQKLLALILDIRPEWKGNPDIVGMVREIAEICSDTNPGWIRCNWCHGAGWVNDYNYRGECGMCRGEKGHWNTLENAERTKANSFVK